MATEVRVTDWITCKDGPWYPTMSHGGYASYRIWQCFDGLRWYQRHEWTRADSSSEMEEWINGIADWRPGSKPVSAQAAGLPA